MKRVVIAFLVAPFPTAFVQAVFVGLWPKKGMGVFEHPQSMFLLMCLLFYVAELFLGLPLYLAMRKRLPQKMLPYGVAGTLMTLLPVIVGLAASTPQPTYVLVYNLALFSVGGFLAGVIFWYIARPPKAVTDLSQTFA